MKRGSKPSAGLFGIILVLFAFPFMAISCKGQTVYEFTGYQLAFGTEAQDLSGLGDGSPVGPYATLIISLAAAVAAAVAAWVGYRTFAVASGSVGLLGLLIFTGQFYLLLHQNSSQDSDVMVRMLIRTAMWLTAGAFVAGIVVAARSDPAYQVPAGQRIDTPVLGPEPVEPRVD